VTATGAPTTAVGTTGLGVSVRGLDVSFPSPGGTVLAVSGVSLEVPAGQFAALLGPSGCGKSTLLRTVAGLQAPTAGDYQILGRSDARRDVAFVFQDPHLLPWRNVLRNAALPLELMGVPKSQRLDAARQALEQVGLADALRRYPAQLSGGMRMRCSLARALVTNPRLLLLDEPFAAVDEITRHRLQEMLRGLYLRRGITVLFVTHSIPEAVFLADRAVVFSPRPARVIADMELALPRNRQAELRTDVEFARQARRLHAALTEGA
jgi:NitT/TauT family transport system ATP-binding protein